MVDVLEPPRSRHEQRMEVRSLLIIATCFFFPSCQEPRTNVLWQEGGFTLVHSRRRSPP